MASLSDDQKASVRMALGYPDGFRQYNTRLESIMDNLSTQGVAKITVLLASLANVELEILESASAAASGVKRVDEITFFDPIVTGGVTIGYKSAQEAARYLVNQISILVGTPINADAYGKQGYPGDTFSGLGQGGLGGGGFGLG